MNSLFNQLNPLSQRLPSNIQNMIQMYKSISNPQQMVNQMLEKNPQLKSIIQSANGNPELAFRNLAKQMNVDPDEIIKLIK